LANESWHAILLGMTAPEGRPAGRTLDVTDPVTLRALAHPLRLELLRLVREHRPVTGARLAELVGESSASVSYHLSVLARHGFIEPATEPGATRRHKPWQPAYEGMRITSDHSDRPPSETVEGVILTSALSHYRAQEDDYVHGRTDLDPGLREVGSFLFGDRTFTPAEFEAFSTEVEEVFERWRGRDGAEPAAGEARFSVSFVAVPVAGPPSGEGSQGDAS
jgi:DNA-binding transcriptional ArsR family regulator